MSSEKFELAEDELDTLLDKVESTMSKYRLIKTEGRRTDEKRQMSMRLRGHIDEAKKLIDEMEYEARKAPMTFRGSMLSTVRDHREQIAKFQNELSISSFSKLKEDESSSSLDLPSETDDPIRRQNPNGSCLTGSNNSNGANVLTKFNDCSNNNNQHRGKKRRLSICQTEDEDHSVDSNILIIPMETKKEIDSI
ncbi:unnamed protein product [Lepeophtheirus salmonis]|uniref:(salmon louse) hypothetical protein n=1 Tax=Lepeophtheirus salmonis TaxID=72036 RepID=A0A7R8HA84_LEPSM|nr:unnamed protein product [Lepeophtheirus salmonis]CAF2968219.1 unnamed protein product [Lepeophtheirus salmonis]